ncbi:unnamed protein product [Merluccius merluccius]
MEVCERNASVTEWYNESGEPEEPEGRRTVGRRQSPPNVSVPRLRSARVPVTSRTRSSDLALSTNAQAWHKVLDMRQLSPFPALPSPPAGSEVERGPPRHPVALQREQWGDAPQG